MYTIKALLFWCIVFCCLGVSIDTDHILHLSLLFRCMYVFVFLCLFSFLTKKSSKNCKSPHVLAENAKISGHQAMFSIYRVQYYLNEIAYVCMCARIMYSNVMYFIVCVCYVLSTELLL